MTIDTLEKLADAAIVEVEPGIYYSRPEAYDEYLDHCSPQTIKSLIALCKLQHEMISKEFDYQLRNDTEVQWHILKALAAFEQFNSGENK